MVKLEWYVGHDGKWCTTAQIVADRWVKFIEKAQPHELTYLADGWDDLLSAENGARARRWLGYSSAKIRLVGGVTIDHRLVARQLVVFVATRVGERGIEWEETYGPLMLRYKICNTEVELIDDCVMEMVNKSDREIIYNCTMTNARRKLADNWQKRIVDG